VSIDEVPPFLRFNRFVLHGYRAAPLSTAGALWSAVGYWHNESLNIATHALGAAVTGYWVASWLAGASRGRYELAAAGDAAPAPAPLALAWPIVLADAASMACFALSARYHTLMAAAADEGAYTRLLAADLAGVVVINAVRARAAGQRPPLAAAC